VDENIKILFVDDEKNVLKSIERLFLDEDYEIYTADSGREALEILSAEDTIKIVISDYKMPEMNGVEFLREVCGRWPNTIRIVFSGFADTASVVEAINEGQIYKFIPKPWRDEEMKAIVAGAIEVYELRKKNIFLNKELEKNNEQLQELNINLEKIISTRTSELLFKTHILSMSQKILNSLPAGVIGLDIDGTVVQINKKAIEILGDKGRNIMGNSRKILSEDINNFIDILPEKKYHTGEIVLGNYRINMRGIYMKYNDGQEGIILLLIEEEL
jgi:two-component system NtrC family sensor kinase